jgi:hypothetical protein
MKKKKLNISFEKFPTDIVRDQEVLRKRVNVVLDEDIHKESIKLAEFYGFDFSSFVNLMLEAALSAEEQDHMISSMFASMLRRRGFMVTKDSPEVGAGLVNPSSEQAKKRKK